jgi:RNA polymerase sigma-54 factor
MKLEMSGQMRMEQRMKLAPHMIQSMEILQLPILALQERIEQELNSNPVLEQEEPASEAAGDESSGPGSSTESESENDDRLEQKTLVVDTDVNKVDDFERLASFGREFGDYSEQAGPRRSGSQDDEVDPKLQAIKNAAALPQSLHEFLTEQWQMVDAPPGVKKAGEAIIDYIDDRGYLSVRLEQLHNQDKQDFTFEDLKEALRLVQTLEPVGVGARDLRECLLIQMAQSTEDMSFEIDLVSHHMDALIENRLPDIAKKMRCTLDQINHAMERFRKLDTSPGLQISQSPNVPITPDVAVEQAEDGGEYMIRLVDDYLPNLRLNESYVEMAKDASVNGTTRKFLQGNIRSAQWILDAIEQRKSTLLKVTRSIVAAQRDFFDKGPLHLKPLPMAKVAEEIGVHVATVSRAVSGKYMQCPWGILPLRKFFSGGVEDAQGQEHSWEAVRVQLQQIIDSEDKANPLSDDQIREKLAAAGFADIARRTVAKYRGLLNVPAARFRKRY